MMREQTSDTLRALWRPLRMLAIAAVLGVATPVVAQQIFPSPEAAMNALGDGVARSDQDALRRVLGAQYSRLLPPQLDQQDVYDFLGAWAAHHAIRNDGDGAASVEVGESGWTFPVPIVKRRSGWQFDLQAGEREVRVRRIGRNEIVAMDTLLQLADAQQRYAEQVGKGAYATQLVSTPGKTNGLYWPSASEDSDSPLGPDALAMVPETPPDEAFYGYRFRIIAAPAGSNSKYGLVAWPARYGETGVHTFLLDSDRNFYQRDFGSATATRAGGIRSLSTQGWQPVAER